MVKAIAFHYFYFIKQPIMKKILLLLCICSIQLVTNAQKIVTLNENETITDNGLEYGYLITNEKNKSVKGEDYDRFELELFVTNKSGCTKVFPFKTNNLGQISEDNNYILADFNVQNATGKRLTAKSGKVEATALRTMVKVDGIVTQSGNNNGFVQALIGYGIRNNAYLKKNIIVIIPKGERPKITCKTMYLPEASF
jgi:hypothetical protein